MLDEQKEYLTLDLRMQIVQIKTRLKLTKLGCYILRDNSQP